MRGVLRLVGAALAARMVAASINVTADGDMSVDELFKRAAMLVNGTKADAATSAPPASSSTLKPVTKSDSVPVSDDLAVYTELYTTDPPPNLRELRDNTLNTEAVVQSARPGGQSSGGSSDQVDLYASPIVVASPGPETAAAAGRRLKDVNVGAGSPLSVLFCDPAGNAIWKWNYFNDAKKAPPVQNSTTTTQTTATTKEGVCDARTTVKVSAFQAGCSRQNHPEGCQDVYYKGCSGLTVNPDSDRVVVARTGGRSLGVLDYKSQAGGTCQGRTVDALTTFKGRKFNSPTAAEFSKKGDLFFTDSPFGLATKASDLDGDILDESPKREIPFNGVYVLKNNSKSVDLVDCTMDRPNKIAFSPKQDFMYITNSKKHDSYVKSFAIASNGTITSSAVFFNFTAHPELETGDGYADGIKVDDDGNVFVVAYKGVYVFSPLGELLVAIRSNQQLSGIAFGADRMFYTGAFGVASQAGIRFSSVTQAITDCK